MEVTAKFLEMLLAGASREDLDLVVAEAEVSGSAPERLDALREQHALALRIQELMARQRSREAELTALYETARDLTAIRDLDAILAAIVRRARQLLGADMTYLSLNDEAEGASYMKVTDGALTPEFQQLRLPLGTGLLGLVAQSGAPYFTEDYQADERFVHRDYIDTAVEGEQIRAILGVPLTVEGHGHRRAAGGAPHGAAVPGGRGRAADLVRRPRRGRAGERPALRAGPGRGGRGRPRPTPSCGERNEATERAAQRPRPAHRRAARTAAAWSRSPTCWPRCSAARSSVYDDEGRLLAGAGPPGSPEAAVERARSSGRCVQTDDGWVAVAAAGEEHLGTLVLRTDRAARPARATHPRARCPGHRAGPALRPHRGRGREPGPRRAARRPGQRPRPRRRPGCANAPGSRAPTSTVTWRSRSPRPVADAARWRGSAAAARPRAARARRRPRGLAVVLAPGDPLRLGEQLRVTARRRHGRGDAGARRRRGPAGLARGRARPWTRCCASVATAR